MDRTNSYQLVSDRGQRPDAAWWDWPTRRHWGRFVCYGAVLLALWCVVYGGADYLTGRHPYRVRLDLAWEQRIPFYPSATIVYLSLFPMLWLAPFVVRDAAGLRRMARDVAWLTGLAGIGFLLLPSEAAFPPASPGGPWSRLFAFADEINLTYNMLPSLHVGFAVLSAVSYTRASGKRHAWLVWGAWAAAISLSTLLTHQHHLADVAAGAALAVAIAFRSHAASPRNQGPET